MRKLKTLIKSGVLLDIYFFKNNRANFISMLLWPYLTLSLMIGAGYLFGSPEAFKKNVGLNVNPVVYFVASTVVMMSCLSVMWEVGGNVLFLRWIGALPYVILAPYRMSFTLVLSYIPRYLLFSLIQVLEFLPLILFLEGITNGLFKVAIILLALTIGMLPLLGFSALFASILLVIEEESNIFSWLNPIILLFSGAFYPAYLLPYWAQFISWILPSTYTVELARLASLMGSPKLSLITFLMGILLGLSFLYNFIAYALIGMGEKKAMRKGVI